MPNLFLLALNCIKLQYVLQKYILYFSIFPLVIGCPCTPADCKKGYICFKGNCVSGQYLCDYASTKYSRYSPEIPNKKPCSSHSDCFMNQMCNYGQCDDVPMGQNYNSLGRFNGKICSRDKDCEWNESCDIHYGICCCRRY